MPRHVLTASLAAALFAACNDTSPAAPTSDAAVITDTPAATDAPAVTDAPAADVPAAQDVAVAADASADVATAAALNGCTEAMYVDQTMGTANDRMIMTQGTTNAFDFPCMTIRAGQSVLFMWAFSRHPLAPGLAPGEAGDAPAANPITPFSTGTVHSIQFPTPGLYPFYCTAHPGTMKGVVRVL